MTEEAIFKNQTVLVRGNKIIKIGPSNNIEAPRNSKIINGDGAFLMPGLADMHMHTKKDLRGVMPAGRWFEKSELHKMINVPES